jgi:hypothetical protein
VSKYHKRYSVGRNLSGAYIAATIRMEGRPVDIPVIGVHRPAMPGGYVVRNANGQAIAYLIPVTTTPKLGRPKC